MYKTFEKEISPQALGKAFVETTNRRHTEYVRESAFDILDTIERSRDLKYCWSVYQTKNPYAKDMEFGNIIENIRSILKTFNITYM